MKFYVKTTGLARLDMRLIYEYIAKTLKAPVTAEKQYSRIEKAIYSLEIMPERFRRYEEEPWRSRNLRVMPVDNYLVLYIVDKKNSVATVIRIMYSARNIKSELFSMSQYTVDE
ncbi:MAG: type II toxin-antitoxin system RelE/ParE family toxin [Peptococcaceae bacterium]|nr:type II toxin-antitoxin system RelE/ParE family toxin [Peptococcaceae bacterium]